MAYAERLPSGRWRGVYRDAGGQKHHTRAFDFKDPAHGEAVRLEQESRRPGWRDPRAGARTWGDWEPTWLAMHRVDAATEKAEASFLKNHIRPRWEGTPLAEIDKGEVREWAKRLGAPKEGGGAELKPSTVARIVAVFRTSLEAAIDAKVLTYNPATRLKLPKPAQGDPKFLTRAEADAVIAALPERHRFLVTFLFNTGLRFGEAAGLRPSRVSGDGARVTVRETWSSSTRRLNAVPKGKTERTIPVPPSLRPEILRLAQAAEGDMVFHPRLDSNNFRNRVWNAAAAAAGVPDATPHDTRHTYGSWLLQAGIPIAEIARLMGHTDEEITRIYARLADLPTDDIFRALEGGGVGQNVGHGATPAASK